ncbi:MAG: WG repeat-containing protein [Saprospiraceae bacterium]|nr:WG repeat-containing protein [Saprospiraceae bacterium]
MRTYVVTIIILFNCISIYSQDIQKYLECENAKIDKISGIEKETIKKVRNKYPIDQFYLSRIDSGIYNVCYKSSSYKWGILNGDELVLPMIYKKVNSSIIKDRGVKRYLIISQYSKVGLFDLQNLTWKIPLIYEDLSKFDGGDYLIYVDRNAGVSTMEGKVILEPIYSRIEFNKNIGVYIVKDLNDNIGIFDPNINSWILPCTFKNVSSYTSKNLILTKNDSTFLFTSNKKIEFHEEIHINDTDQVIIIGEKGKYTIQDYNHKKVIKTEFSDIDYLIGHSDLITKLKNNKYSLFNTALKKSMDKLYDNIKRVRNNFLVQKNYKYGVVKFEDDKYIEILPCIFDEIDIELEYYIAKKEGENFIYTKQGKKIIDENFDDIRIITFYSNKNIVSGNKQFAENSNYGELVIIGTSEKYSVFNLQGERMIKKDYQHIAPLITYMHDSRRTNTQLCVGLIYKENHFYGIMDLNGNIILSAEYSEIRHLNRGLAQIRKNEEYAIFDYVNNRFLTQFKYSQLMSYNDDCIGIINNDYYKIKIYENFKEGKIVNNVIENKLELNFLSRNSTKKNNNNLYYQNIEPTKSDTENMKKIIDYYNNSTYHYYIVNNGLYYVEENHNKGVYYDSIGMLTPFYANRHDVTRFSPLLKNNTYPIPILFRYGLYDLKNRKYKILPKYDNFKV